MPDAVDLAGGPPASWLGTRFGPRALAAGAGGAYMVALVLLALGTQIGALWLVIVGLIGSGLAFGHAQPPLIVIASKPSHPTASGWRRRCSRPRARSAA